MVIRSRVLCNNYLEGFFTHIFTKIGLASIVERRKYIFYNQEPIICGVFLKSVMPLFLHGNQQYNLYTDVVLFFFRSFSARERKILLPPPLPPCAGGQ